MHFLEITNTSVQNILSTSQKHYSDLNYIISILCPQRLLRPFPFVRERERPLLGAVAPNNPLPLAGAAFDPNRPPDAGVGAPNEPTLLAGVGAPNSPPPVGAEAGVDPKIDGAGAELPNEKPVDGVDAWAMKMLISRFKKSLNIKMKNKATHHQINPQITVLATLLQRFHHYY